MKRRSIHKPLLVVGEFAAVGHQLPISRAATTINVGNHYAYGANVGWIEGRGDVANGAVIGEFVCSACLYAANVGWISLGNGSPTNSDALHLPHDDQHRGCHLVLALHRLDVAAEHQQRQLRELEQRDQRHSRRRLDQDTHRQSAHQQPLLSASLAAVAALVSARILW